jgi:hypothetical protein
MKANRLSYCSSSLRKASCSGASTEKRREPKRQAQFQAEKLSTLGAAWQRLELSKERLTENTRQRCRIYRDVALENNCQAMLSESKLDALKDQIMAELHCARSALKHCNANAFFAAGDVSPVAATAVQDQIRWTLSSRQASPLSPTRSLMSFEAKEQYGARQDWRPGEVTRRLRQTIFSTVRRNWISRPQRSISGNRFHMCTGWLSWAN